VVVQTPLGEAGASPSQDRTNRPDGAQKMAVWIEKWNYCFSMVSPFPARSTGEFRIKP
jgi:hypothetical protein